MDALPTGSGQISLQAAVISRLSTRHFAPFNRGARFAADTEDDFGIVFSKPSRLRHYR
jgi:hypothetical protein